MKRFVLPHAFWLRVVLFGGASLVLLLAVGALFESASGSDFEPLRAGKLFATYHASLAGLLAVLSIPALIIYPILTHFGVDPNWGDYFYLIFIGICDGLLMATVFHAVHRFRSRRQLAHDAPSTI